MRFSLHNQQLCYVMSMGCLTSGPAHQRIPTSTNAYISDYKGFNQCRLIFPTDGHQSCDKSTCVHRRETLPASNCSGCTGCSFCSGSPASSATGRAAGQPSRVGGSCRKSGPVQDEPMVNPSRCVGNTDSNAGSEHSSPSLILHHPDNELQPV